MKEQPLPHWISRNNATKHIYHIQIERHHIIPGVTLQDEFTYRKVREVLCIRYLVFCMKSAGRNNLPSKMVGWLNGQMAKPFSN